MYTYAIISVSAAFACGIALATVLSPAPALLIAAATGFLAASFVARRASTPRAAALLFAVALLGMLRSLAEPSFPNDLVLRAPRIREVTGRVVSYPSLGEGRIRFTVQPDQLSGKILVTWDCSAGPARVLHYGDRVRAAGRSELPTAFGGFDYAAYLERQGIFATMRVEEGGLSIDSTGNGLLPTGDRIRQALLGALHERLQPREFALAQSYVFGDRFALSDDTETAFTSTGLMHILAVSGMHLAILLAGAWWALRALRVRPALAYPLLAAGVLVAVWIIGPWISFARSALLFAFLALGSVLADLGLALRASVRPMNALAAAALVLLGLDPASLFDVGFQLSVGATAGLMAFASRATPRRKSREGTEGARAGRVRRAARSLFLVSLAAQAGATPILVSQFERLQIWTAVTGIVAIPVASVSLWIGVLSLASSPLGVVGDVLARIFGWSLRFFEAIVVAASQIPGTTLPADPRLGLWIAGCVVFLASARASFSHLSPRHEAPSDSDG